MFLMPLPTSPLFTLNKIWTSGFVFFSWAINHNEHTLTTVLFSKPNPQHDQHYVLRQGLQQFFHLDLLKSSWRFYFSFIKPQNILLHHRTNKSRFFRSQSRNKILSFIRTSQLQEVNLRADVTALLAAPSSLGDFGILVLMTLSRQLARSTGRSGPDRRPPGCWCGSPNLWWSHWSSCWAPLPPGWPPTHRRLQSRADGSEWSDSNRWIVSDPSWPSLPHVNDLPASSQSHVSCSILRKAPWVILLSWPALAAARKPSSSYLLEMQCHLPRPPSSCHFLLNRIQTSLVFSWLVYHVKNQCPSMPFPGVSTLRPLNLHYSQRSCCSERTAARRRCLCSGSVTFSSIRWRSLSLIKSSTVW